MSGGEWLDKPDSDKEMWLVMREGAMRLVTVCLARKLCWPVTSSGSPTGWPMGEITQWHHTPTPPPPPLPKSRMVEMTARVTEFKSHYHHFFRASVRLSHDSAVFASQDGTYFDYCAKWVRDHFGIEPTIGEPVSE